MDFASLWVSGFCTEISILEDIYYYNILLFVVIILYNIIAFLYEIFYAFLFIYYLWWEYGIAVKFLLVGSSGLARFWKTTCSGSGSKSASRTHSRPPRLSYKGFAFPAECCLRRLRIAWLMTNVSGSLGFAILILKMT